MTKKRQLRFTIIRSLVAIFIALLVATLLIFISAEGSTFLEKLDATREALKQMLAGPVFRFSKKSGTSFEAKRLADILAAMIPTTFTGLSTHADVEITRLRKPLMTLYELISSTFSISHTPISPAVCSGPLRDILR